MSNVASIDNVSGGRKKKNCPKGYREDRRKGMSGCRGYVRQYTKKRSPSHRYGAQIRYWKRCPNGSIRERRKSGIAKYGKGHCRRLNESPKRSYTYKNPPPLGGKSDQF
jgi:hypothetical protein